MLAATHDFTQEIIMEDLAAARILPADYQQTAFAPPVSARAGAETAALISMIERVVLDPNVSMDRLERLLDMQERVIGRNAEAAYADAFALMQPELPVIDENGAIKNKQGEVQSTYAEWSDINEAIKPVLATHGFGLSFLCNQAPGEVTITGVLRHRAGYTERTSITLPIDMTGSKNGVQGVGSSTSYGQRYTAKLLLNLTSRAKQDRDDDGQKGGAPLAVTTSINAIDLCETAAELTAWKKANGEMIQALPADQADLIVRAWNARARKLREVAQ